MAFNPFNFFKNKPKKELPKTTMIGGYEIVGGTCEIISAPKNLKVYAFPAETRDVREINRICATAEVLDFSKTMIPSLPLGVSYCSNLRQIIVPNHFTAIKISSQFIRNGQPVEISIPAKLESISPDLDCPFNKKIILPEGTKQVGVFSHNNCTEEIYIPGTLIDKKLPNIYENKRLKVLKIGEGIQGISGKGRSYYYGLNALEFVSLPTTLNEFYLFDFGSRNVNYPLPVFAELHYQEELTIEKAFAKDSVFGETKITFKIPRKEEYYNGHVKIEFLADRVIINDYSISYESLTPGGSYYVDYTNQKLKSIPNTQDKEEVSTKVSKELDIECYYQEFSQRLVEAGVRAIDKKLPQISCTNAKAIWAMLYERGEFLFLDDTYDNEILITKEKLFSMMIESLENRGLEIKNGICVQNYLPGESYRPIPYTYLEIVIIDFLITNLMESIEYKKLADYLYSIMQKKDDNQDFINHSLNFLPQGNKSYSAYLTPSVLRRVISYCGIKEINPDTVMQYITDLDKRNKLHKNAKK